MIGSRKVYDKGVKRRNRMNQIGLLLLSAMINTNEAFIVSNSYRKLRYNVLKAGTKIDLPKNEERLSTDDHGRYIHIPESLRTTEHAIETLDASTYEAALIDSWEKDVTLQRGFDWEIEKLRRYFGGLRMLPDGTWVRQESMLDFLVSRAAIAAAQKRKNVPKPVNFLDGMALTTMNILGSLGLRDAIGLSAVPNAVIQKYEGSFFSFIKGVLGGDLQTLAGGPLFLLLAKYYETYGAVFNLSFGPKSFLVVSDPVMARHILRERTPNDYDKGMLAEILDPIMGKGLIPADPETWRVSQLNFLTNFCHSFLIF